MIIHQPDGIKYYYSDEILSYFKNLLIKPFEQHIITKAWQKEVLDSYNNKDFKTIREIVGGGQADFEEPFRGLTPEERVLVYCYNGNMQQHTVSQLYIFEKHANIFDKYFFEPERRVIFIDFGCGPLSSGIALAMYYAQVQKSNSQKFFLNYIGMDKAESMLLKAKEFSRYPNLFPQETTFYFINTYKEASIFKYRLYQCLDSYISKNALIILNFSYLFASESLDIDKLIRLIQEILSTYESQQVCLIFQNPPGTDLNIKWNKFQSQIKELKTVIKGPISEKFNFYCIQSKRKRNTQLYYDIKFRTN
ncbi:hypothetical protein NIES2101_11280 [Calothrix sp. HK-06]|nr:hypothetical protein NIES2101_11280 [Calothrix sp. HK-06]